MILLTGGKDRRAPKEKQDLNALKSGLTRTWQHQETGPCLTYRKTHRIVNFRIFNALCSPFSSREELEEKCTNLQVETKTFRRN